jgi:hypothetical protein
MKVSVKRSWLTQVRTVYDQGPHKAKEILGFNNVMMHILKVEFLSFGFTNVKYNNMLRIPVRVLCSYSIVFKL